MKKNAKDLLQFIKRRGNQRILFVLGLLFSITTLIGLLSGVKIYNKHFDNLLAFYDSRPTHNEVQNTWNSVYSVRFTNKETFVQILDGYHHGQVNLYIKMLELCDANKFGSVKKIKYRGNYGKEEIADVSDLTPDYCKTLSEYFRGLRWRHLFA